MVNTLGSSDRHNIRTFPLLQPPSQASRHPIDRVGNNPPRGNVRFKRPLQHPFGQLALGRKTYSLRDTSLREPLQIVRPLARQVQRPIYERRTLVGGIAEKYPNLAVLLLACRPRVLACYS